MSTLGGDYSSSDDSESRRRRRNRRRRRSSVGIGYSAAGTSPQMIGGRSPYLQPTYGGAQLQPQVAQVPGAYGLSPNLGGGIPLPGVNYQQAAMQPQYVQSYPAAQPGYAPAYGAGGLGVPQVPRPRANSFGYPTSPTYF